MDLIIEVTPQTIITAGAIFTALGVLVGRFAKGVRWFDKQEKQSTDIEALREKEEQDIKALREAMQRAMASFRKEQQLLTYGSLACLKVLKEQGCNGPVTEAVNKIEKYLNQKAHEN